MIYDERICVGTRIISTFRIVPRDSVMSAHETGHFKNRELLTLKLFRGNPHEIYYDRQMIKMRDKNDFILNLLLMILVS